MFSERERDRETEREGDRERGGERETVHLSVRQYSKCI